MAYDPTGLFCVRPGPVQSEWLLRTTDIVGDADATGYITDAGPTLSGKGVAGRGMKLGDIVHVQVVNNVATPTSVSDQGLYYCSAVNATTGAGTITAYGAA